MARSTTNIQAEIDRLETFLQSAESVYTSVGSDGTSRTIDRKNAQDRLTELYIDLGRASGNSPRFVRGFVTGLR